METLTAELTQTPPATTELHRYLEMLADALCRFVPSKVAMHERIRADILGHSDVLGALDPIAAALVKWIKCFHAPADDAKADALLGALRDPAPPLAQKVLRFLPAYCAHAETTYLEVWQARRRLIEGGSVIPPEHRPKELRMRSGRK
jgi:hypothetical protein